MRPTVTGFAVILGVFAQVSVARADDMLSGGLLGSLLHGEEFTGPRLIDLVVLGLAMFVVLRLVLGRSRKSDPGTPPRYTPPPQDDASFEAPPPLDAPSNKPNMYTNAQSAWDMLKSRPANTTAGPASTAQPQAAPPNAATPEEEFLAGAKLVYSRVIIALASRDFADLAQFVSPAFLTQLKNSLPDTPPGHPDILLVEASLASQREENGQTIMEVEYTVLVRDPGASQNTERHEHWRFARDNATPGANWLLEKMERR